MPGLAAKLVPTLLGPGASAEAQAAAEAVMARVPQATYRRVLEAIVAFDRREALPAIKVPTLCLAAEHDQVAPPDVLRVMADQIPDSEFALISGAGHLALVEQAKVFDDTVIDFVRRRCAA